MRLRHGFTLLEMLISTVLMSLVLFGLYGALDMQQTSTKHLFDFLGKALDADRGVVVLYRDIFQSDGNITIKNGEFDRLCLNNTSHSLHGLAQAKVCWIVSKEDKALLRIEGNGFRLPLKFSDGVEIDEVMKPVSLFDIQKDKKKVLVGLQQINRDPYVFLVQGIEPPPKKVKKKPPPKTNKGKNNSQPSKKKGSSNPTGKAGSSSSDTPKTDNQGEPGESVKPSKEPGGPGELGPDGNPNMF
jgi:prepilin-type N-terminal cleavage/methylation domain-containing protein